MAAPRALSGAGSGEGPARAALLLRSLTASTETQGIQQPEVKKTLQAAPCPSQATSLALQSSRKVSLPNKGQLQAAIRTKDISGSKSLDPSLHACFFTGVTLPCVRQSTEEGRETLVRLRTERSSITPRSQEALQQWQRTLSSWNKGKIDSSFPARGSGDGESEGFGDKFCGSNGRNPKKSARGIP